MNPACRPAPLAALAFLFAAISSAMAQPAVLSAARLVPLGFGDIAGWKEDRQGEALAAFRRSCAAPPASRQTGFAADALAPACRAAARLPRKVGDADARAFFAAQFSPYRVVPMAGAGFLTGYFEPEVSGSLVPTARFTTPLMALPEGHATLAADGQPPPLAGLTAARRMAAGLAPYPDRAAIEDGALGNGGRPIVYLDWVDAFFVHVQGSARVRVGSGSADVIRLAYAGRNGHPYTSLGKLVVAETGIPPEEMTAPALIKWLRENPEAGSRLMRKNKSYIFFRRADELDADAGPVGAAGVQLKPGRSLAVDDGLWPYGLPVWLDASLPAPDRSGPQALRRLVIAQDTGTAIRGPARGDIFFGSGEAAGAAAGIVRHAPAAFIVLLPKGSGPQAGAASP